MKIVFATGNSGKLREASEILGGGFELVSPAEMGITEDIPETGSSLRANSLQKALYIKEHCGCYCFADDTGLETEILGGAPGIYSARYAGEAKDDKANMRKLLKDINEREMEASHAREWGLNTVHATRRARFRTVITLILGKETLFFEGTMKGKIALCPHGNGGFGYDPVFIADDYPDKTVAELTEEQKNEISHRGKAMRAMADYLHSLQK